MNKSILGYNRTKRRRLMLEQLDQRMLFAVNVIFDYRYDLEGFFNRPGARAALEAAGATIGSAFNDHLLEINPFKFKQETGANVSWNATFVSPGDKREFLVRDEGGCRSRDPITRVCYSYDPPSRIPRKEIRAAPAETTITNLVVPENSVVIFVGSGRQTQKDGVLATAYTIDPGASGSAAWRERVFNRGQNGVKNNTDFSTWGGSFSVNPNANWNFAIDTAVAGKEDFYSVAVHEIGHLFGLISSSDTTSYKAKITNNEFTGANARAVFGGNVPLQTPGNGHLSETIYVDNNGVWKTTSGTIPAPVDPLVSNRPAMNPFLTTGRRQNLTNLDFAVFRDIGWELGTSSVGFFADTVTGTVTDSSGRGLGGVLISASCKSTTAPGGCPLTLIDPIVGVSKSDGTYVGNMGALDRGVWQLYAQRGLDQFQPQTVTLSGGKIQRVNFQTPSGFSLTEPPVSDAGGEILVYGIQGNPNDISVLPGSTGYQIQMNGVSTSKPSGKQLFLQGDSLDDSFNLSFPGGVIADAINVLGEGQNGDRGNDKLTLTSGAPKVMDLVLTGVGNGSMFDGKVLFTNIEQINVLEQLDEINVSFSDGIDHTIVIEDDGIANNGVSQLLIDGTTRLVFAAPAKGLKVVSPQSNSSLVVDSLEIAPTTRFEIDVPELSFINGAGSVQLASTGLRLANGAPVTVGSSTSTIKIVNSVNVVWNGTTSADIFNVKFQGEEIEILPFQVPIRLLSSALTIQSGGGNDVFEMVEPTADFPGFSAEPPNLIKPNSFLSQNGSNFVGIRFIGGGSATSNVTLRQAKEADVFLAGNATDPREIVSFDSKVSLAFEGVANYYFKGVGNHLNINGVSRGAMDAHLTGGAATNLGGNKFVSDRASQSPTIAFDSFTEFSAVGSDSGDKFLVGPLALNLNLPVSSRLKKVSILAMEGDDSFTADQIAPEVAAFLYGNSGNDTFNIGRDVSFSRQNATIQVEGGTDFDEMQIIDSGEVQGHRYSISEGRLGNTSAQVSFQTLERVRLFAGTASDKFDVSPSLTTEFVIDANDTAGSGNLDQKDFLAINSSVISKHPNVVFDVADSGRQQGGAWSFDSPLKGVQFKRIEQFNLLEKLMFSSDAAWNTMNSVGVRSSVLNTEYSKLVSNFTPSDLSPFSPIEFPSPVVGGKDMLSNFLIPSDVNNDGNVSPLDALVVINHLNRRSSSGSGVASFGFVDVNNDGNVSPIDALIVINTLNRGARPSVTFGGVRTTSADLNYDGVDEVIAVSGANHVPTLLVFNGVTGQLMGSPKPLTTTTDNFGSNVAAGDIDGDGKVEIITSSDRGPGIYSIWRWENGLISKIADRSISFSAGYLGGVRVSTGDLNGDGKSEIIVASGTGADASVRAYDANGFQLSSFLLAPSFGRGGVYVATGDYNGDGRSDLFVSSGRRGNAQIQVFDGVASLGNTIASSHLISGAYTGQDAIAPISIALKDSDGDEEKELYSSQLSDGRSDQLKKWEFSEAADAFFSTLQSDLDPDWSSGAYLG